MGSRGGGARCVPLAPRILPRYACGVTAAFRPVARLIAMVLLLQVVLAPAHCLAMAATPSGLETVICSPDGTRSIHLGPDGQEMPAHDGGPGFCLSCHGVPQAWLPPAPAVAAPAWIAATIGWQPTPAHALPQAARAPPFAPRAPPAFA